MSYARTGCRLTSHAFLLAPSRVDLAAGAVGNFSEGRVLPGDGRRRIGHPWSTAHVDHSGGLDDVTSKRSRRHSPATRRPEKPTASVLNALKTANDSFTAGPDCAFHEKGRLPTPNRQEGLLGLEREADGGHAVTDAALSPIITAMVDALADDPALSGAEFAQRYPISLSQLVRLFKSQVGVSMVEYRNRLRLDRFWKSVFGGQSNLMQASKDAGFGSYAQFHRVFRKIYGDTPRIALRRPPPAFEPDRTGMSVIAPHAPIPP